MQDLTVVEVHGRLATFARHHGLPVPGRGDVLRVDSERDSGGFGRILPVIAVNGSPTSQRILAKEFTLSSDQGATRRDVIDGVTGLHSALDARPDSLWMTLLLALPYWIGEAGTGSERQLVVLMRDLASLGYESGTLVDADRRRAFVRITSLNDRIELAYRFSVAAAYLASIPFVHADHHPENLMVNTMSDDVQVIDYDAGAVVGQAQGRPLTPGHPDAYMPPEIKGSGSDAPQTLTYDLAAERWAIGLLIGQILIGVRQPVYFLRAISARAIQEYARSGWRWPQIDTSSELFRKGADESYEKFRVAVEALPHAIVERLADLFEAGLNGGRRPSPGEWMTTLESARRPPAIRRITVSSDFVLEGSEVEVAWETAQADAVDCTALGGRLAPSGSARLTVGAATPLLFRATNRWGSSERSGPTIRVVPLPRIRWIPVPAFPDLSVSTEIPVPEGPVLGDAAFPVAPSPEMFFAAHAPAPRNTGPRLPATPPIPDLLAVDLIPEGLWQDFPPQRLS